MAACTIISTRYSGPASFASTVALTGVQPLVTQSLPGRVHVIEVPNVGQPDVAYQEPRLVRPSHLEQPIDLL